MSITILDERYCTVQESIIESFKEVKLMREGKLPKKSWKDFMKEHKKREENEWDMCYTIIPTPKFLQDIDCYEKKKKFKILQIMLTVL